MKKANRIVTIVLMVCMALTSGGLLYATMYASGAGTQSTQTTVAFDAPSGIRYNELTGAFEVFSGVGVSWIGSNGWVSTLGEYDKSTDTSPSETGTAGVWYQATKTSTYTIMCDIAYSSVFVKDSTTTFVTEYNEAFNAGITLDEGGKINGRGFYLSGFPMRDTATSSALIKSNSGIIRGVNLIDVNFASVTADRTAAGILCETNEKIGLIDECAVYGKYTVTRFISLYGIAALNIGTIKNTTNNADISNRRDVTTYTAGIAEIAPESNTVNNINNGDIYAFNRGGRTAGIAISLFNAEFIASGNTNNGNVTSNGDTSVSANNTTGSATGVIGGNLEPLYDMRAVNNTNNGLLSARRIMVLLWVTGSWGRQEYR